jgi:3-hydroxyacyl-CoA dehydrogenase
LSVFGPVEGFDPRIFGEREVAKIPDAQRNFCHSVNSVAVVGAGTMGVASRWCLPTPVFRIAQGSDQAALDRGLANIQKNYDTSVKRGASRSGSWMSD